MLNKNHKPENVENMPEIHPEASETQSEPISAPHQKPTRQNSLQDLPQYDEAQFGCGKHQHVMTSCTSAGVVDIKGAFMTEVEGVSESGGVKLNVDETKWFVELTEQAIETSEDEPSLTEALGGDECSAWSDVIDAELTQMEKVNAWVPVIPP